MQGKQTAKMIEGSDRKSKAHELYLDTNCFGVYNDPSLCSLQGCHYRNTVVADYLYAQLLSSIICKR